MHDLTARSTLAGLSHPEEAGLALAGEREGPVRPKLSLRVSLIREIVVPNDLGHVCDPFYY